MKELNHSQRILYTQALQDPSQLSEENLLQLIVRYPYSQPLIFAYERRKMQFGESSLNKSLALLYAPSATWLWTFVNQHILIEQQIAIPTIVDAVLPAEDDEEEASIETVTGGVLESLSIVVETPQEDEQEQQAEVEVPIVRLEKDELDLLVSQGSVMADYLIYEHKSQVALQEVSSEKEEQEDVSLYNDDLMPYSFRWWLQKTRLEHAATYQPFTSAAIFKTNAKGIDFGKLDDTILDQQIKVNVIHFQDPEAKLSDQVKNRPIQAASPKKTDTIIERFIREEPIIQAPSAENLNNENMARQSAEDNYVLVTETLANIYKDQGLQQKAIEVFEKLILKYPKKKSYFASQIQELEKNL